MKYYQPTYEIRVDSQGRRYKVFYCVRCNVDVTKDMEHCEDCDVCVDNYDHHCVFFSKCIGGGNIYCFGGAIGMLIFNFILMFVFMMMDINPEKQPQYQNSISKRRNERRKNHLSEENNLSLKNNATLNLNSIVKNEGQLDINQAISKLETKGEVPIVPSEAEAANVSTDNLVQQDMPSVDHSSLQSLVMEQIKKD